MKRDNRKLLVDGYSARSGDGTGKTRGYQATGGMSKPPPPPAKFPNVSSAVQKPKKS